MLKITCNSERFIENLSYIVLEMFGKKLSHQVEPSNTLLDETTDEKVWYACHNHIKKNKKLLLHTLVFFIGISILIWQIEQTIEQFIDGHTTFDVYKESHESMVPPAMVFCPKPEWNNGIYTEANISDKDWFFSQFFHLNYNLTLILKRMDYNPTLGYFHVGYSNFSLGDNFDEFGKTFTVEELMSPFIGLCYGLIPDPSFKMTIKTKLDLSIEFKQEAKIPPVEVYFGKAKDRYGTLALDVQHEVEEPYKVSLESGNWLSIGYRSLIYNYLSKTKRYCKNYSETDSSIQCILEKVVDCYKIIGPSRSCNCIPENIFKTHFEMYPITPWEICKTTQEYRDCFATMHDCYFNETVSHGCPIPCKTEVYKGRNWKPNGFGKIPPNMMGMSF